MAGKTAGTASTKFTSWATAAEQVKAMWRQLFADVEAFRRDALSPARDRVRNPAQLREATKLSGEVMTDHVRLMAELNRVLPGLQFWDTLMAEIASESPECAQRVKERLRRLMAARGLIPPTT